MASFRMWGVLFIGAAASCSGISTPEVGPPSWADPMCLPEFVGHSLTPAPGRTGGAAVAVAKTGANLFASGGPYPVPDRIDVVSGAPGESRLGSYGEVGFQPIDVLDGTPDGGALPSVDHLVVSGLDPGGRFGAAVVAADIVEHFDDRVARSTHGLLAAGHEVLVGEPDTDLGGRVHWLYAAYDADPDIGPLSSPDLYRWEPGGVFDPGLGAGAGFGATIAVPADPGWGSQIPYAVIAAPRIDAIFVTPLTPAWTPGTGGSAASATPFTTSTRIDGSAVGLPARGYASHFGHALLIDDLDGDGTDDLIVGAPGDYCPASGCTPGVPATATVGEVFVIPGVSPGVFDTSQAFLITPPTTGGFTPGSGFGASLAAGFLHDAPGSGGTPTLVIGAPRAQHPIGASPIGVDPGQVCQLHFPGGFPAGGTPAPAPDCDVAPWDTIVMAGPAGMDFMHLFGESVAVANLTEQDSVGSNASVEGAMEELIVSSPRSQHAKPGVYVKPGTSGKLVYGYGGTPARGTPTPLGPPGVVAVFKSVQGQGAVIKLEEKTIESLALQTLSSASTPTPGEGLGRALTIDHLSVIGPLPDLVLGEPDGGGGQLSFTRSSLGVNGFTSGIGGQWSTTDSAGTSRPIALLPSDGDYGVLLDAFELELREDGGNPTSPACTNSAFPGSVSLSAYFDNVAITEDPDPTDTVPATTPTQSIELVDTSGAAVLRFDADILHQDLSGAHTLSLTLSNPQEPASGGSWRSLWPGEDCRPVTGPGGGTFVLELEVENACE